MPDITIPDYAHTVLVPIANPATAPILLDLAAKLVDPDGGRLVALFISLGAGEADSKLASQISPMIEGLRSKGYAAELKVHISTSASRGILDVAREEHTDLLVLGTRQPERSRDGLGGVVESMMALVPGRGKRALRQNVSLGSIVDSVVSVAPCDVLVYRAVPQVEFRRIVVPVDGSLHSAIACQIGILLGESYRVAVEAIYVQESYRPQWEGRGRIEQALVGLAGQQRVTRTVVTAHDAAGGILSTANRDDLIIVGVSERSTLNRWLFGDVTGRILQSAPGPLIVLRRSGAQNGKGGVFSWFINRLTLTLTEAEQDEILWQAEEMASSTLDYLVLIAVSVILASLGLLMDSPAVIIGAMLVAPLMQPLIGFASGIATGRLDLVGRALWTLLQGASVALLVSIALGLLISPERPTVEMLARSNPGLLDVGVALAAGIIGAYATARKDIPAALAGVAIAAALMPPLCTAGLFFGMGRFDLGNRAGLLFLTNIVCISLAAWLVFFWAGLRPRLESTSRRRQYTSLALGVALMLPVVVALLSLSHRQSQETIIVQNIQERFLPAEVVGVEVVTGEPARVIVTLRTADDVDPSRVESAQDALSHILGYPVQLEVVLLKVVKPQLDVQEESP